MGDDLRGDGDGLATLGRGRKLDARDTQPEWDCDRGRNVKSRSSRRWGFPHRQGKNLWFWARGRLWG